MSSLTLVEKGERIPDLELAQKKFILTLPEYRDDSQLKSELLEIITNKNMTPWYEIVCEELGWERDNDLLEEMRRNNEEVLNGLDESIEAAKKDLSKVDVKEGILKKANYLIEIGDKTRCLSALAQAYDYTVAIGYRIDNIFTCIRIGFFFMDHDLIKRNIERGEDIVEMGADYDKRNCFKVYKGLYDLTLRNFKSATNNFLGVLSTFTCTELIDYVTFIRYTVYTVMLTLSRNELEQKLIKCSDVLEVLYRAPDVKQYLFSLYECDYTNFFKNLADVEEVLRKDYILNPHYGFYVREMRILAYAQFLASYKTLTLSHMAERFGVTSEFIEDEISRFIGAGKIYAKIDKVQGVIIVNKDNTERKGESFKDVVKDGDLLLNRVQNLSRFVDGK